MAWGGDCYRVWGHVAGVGVSDKGWRNATGGGVETWQGMGACGRVWGHVAGCEGMWQGVLVCGWG